MRMLVVVLAGIVAALVAGCSGTGGGPVLRRAPAATKNIDPQEVQESTMSFATRYVVAVADVCERTQARATTQEARSLILRNRLLAGMGAMGNAVNPNPIVGLMDMAIMVTLTRGTFDIPAVAEVLGPESHAMFVEFLAVQEQDVWRVAGSYLTEDQVGQLKAVAKQWREAHPGQEFVGGARLADLPQSKQNINNPGAQLANSIFGLVRLDPFTGLDPAVRQVEESRILAERMFFYLQNMPTLLSWQTDLLYFQMLTQPQVTQLFKDTSVVSANTTGFTKATGDFAEACTRFASTIEAFRKELPEQQAALVKQLNEMLAAQLDATLKQTNKDVASLRDSTVQQLNETVGSQREAALKQASAEIAVQRDAVLKQLAETVTTQQDLLAKNTQAVMDSSIDQLYGKLRNLILIAAVSLFVVLVAFRLVSRYLLTGKAAARLPEEAGASRVRG